MDVHLTLWPSLYDIDSCSTWVGSWPELAEELSTHEVTPDKMNASGFGPYRLKPPSVTCFRHSAGARKGPHRCDSCVAEMTLLVFDVDQGTADQISNAQDNLDAAGLSQIWYSSYSFRGEIAPGDLLPMRLLVPLSRPLTPLEFGPVRSLVLDEFAIPADRSACSGLSHFYFLPSRAPISPSYTRIFYGQPLNVERLLEQVPVTPAVPAGVEMDGWEPPPEPTGPVDMKPLYERLERRYRSLAASARPGGKDKAELLRRCLDGRALAEHGARNTSALVVSGILAYALPGVPPGILKAIMKPSIDRMIADGSRSVTWPGVEKMIHESMRNKAEVDRKDANIREVLQKQLKSVEENVR
jgi:hypothetical protein